jgi:soluble lytic murein transglycosylase
MLMRHLVLVIFIALLAPPLTAHAGIPQDVSQWSELRNPKRVFSFEKYARFIADHPDWPETYVLREAAERALSKGNVSDARIREFFGHFAPVSDDGKLAYIRALARGDEITLAMAKLREAWEAGAFSAAQQDFIMQHWRGSLSAKSHETRLDNLLWQGNLSRAERALTYVDINAMRIGRLRIRLQRSDRGAEASALTLLNADNASGGLHFDLARFYRGRDRNQQAAQITARFLGSKAGREKMWWRERHILARHFLEKGEFKLAYAIAAAHGMKTPAELAEAEWLAGWISVTRLKDPRKAIDHFDTMFRNVKTPISVARAGYWAGIAAQQLGDNDIARQWYEQAAVHPHVFYGQMAAYALGEPQKYYDAFHARSRKIPAPHDLREDLVSAARIFYKAGRSKERDLFLQAALNAAMKDGNAASIIAVAAEMNSAKIKLLAAKAAYEQNVLVADALFPSLRVPIMGNVENALTLGVVRQESQFDTHALSPAGARGLMQLMPATAKQTAREKGLPWQGTNALEQPHYNMQLGQAYLEKMLRRYDYFVPLAAAAYNAGPRNVDKWLVTNGDPRANPESWVDWAERIPFYETRNYVQRVWESYSFYKSIGADAR